MTTLHKMIKILDVTLRERKFYGTYPILVFYFAARFVEECNKLKMSERQALVALPDLLKGRAETQCRASGNRAGTGGVSSWPYAVQYSLRTYSTPAAIIHATKEFNYITKLQDEDEIAYASRINEAAYRCGNVHTKDENMTKCLYGFLGCIRFLVARFLQNLSLIHI